MRPKARFLMAFPLPLPKRCRGHGKWSRKSHAVMIAFSPRVTKPAAVSSGAIELRSGRKNGFAEVEQKNAQFGKSHANFSCSS